MNKKAWLDFLYYSVGSQKCDFFLQVSEKDGIKTKWRRFSEAIFPIDFDGGCEDRKKEWFFYNCNQRQILPCEIVLDMEEKESIKILIPKLKELGLEFYIFDTGSRGYHIHLFFSRDLDAQEKLNVLTYFEADLQKATDKTLISLEFAPHWKSGKIKTLVGVEDVY